MPLKPNLDLHGQKPQHGLIDLSKMLEFLLFALFIISSFCVFINKLNLKKACNFAFLPMLSHAHCQGIFPSDHVFVDLNYTGEGNSGAELFWRFGNRHHFFLIYTHCVMEVYSVNKPRFLMQNLSEYVLM
jgi:hypothetical protein